MFRSKTLSLFLYKYLWFAGFLFLFSLGQLQRIQLTSSIAIYAHEIFASVWIVKELKGYFSWLKYSFFNQKWIQKKYYFLFFALYIIFQLVIQNMVNFQLTQFAYYIRAVFYIGLLLFFFFQYQTKKLSPLNFKIATGFIGLFVATAGLLQYLIIPDSRFLIYSGWDDHYYRLISTFFDPGFTAIILILIFLALFSWQIKRTLFFSYIISPLFLVAILLTYSRAGYLSILVGLITIFLMNMRKITHKWKTTYSLIVGIIFVVLIPFLPKPGGEGVNLLRTSSIEQRIESNQSALQQLNWKTFLFGSGFYRYVTVKDSVPNHATAPDNSLIFIFTSLGIVGALMLLLALYKYKNHLFADNTLLVVGSALVVNSLFNNSLFYLWNWVVLGFVVLGDEKKQ